MSGAATFPDPTVVVVPFYNVESTQPRPGEPGAQPASDIEFILVDDGSTDTTPAILADRADLGRVRVLTHPHNAGLSAARNTGLDAARGTYIAFLDGDDWVEQGYYPKLLNTIERLGCAMVRTDHVKVRGRLRTVHRISHGPRGVVMSPRSAILPADRMTSVDSPNAWAGIYHRRLADDGVLRFAEGLRTAEDRLWIWRMHLRAPTFAVVGLIGLFYRRGVTTSLSEVGDERQLDFIDAYELIVAELADDPEGPRFLPKAIRSFCAMIDHHLVRQDRLAAATAVHMRELCRESLAKLPRAEVMTAVSNMSAERRERLQAVLPG